MTYSCDNCKHSIDDHTFGQMMVLRPDCIKCNCKQFKSKKRDNTLNSNGTFSLNF